MSSLESGFSERDNRDSGSKIPVITKETISALGASMAEEGPEEFSRATLERLSTENPLLLQAIAATAEDFSHDPFAKDAYIDGAVMVVRLLISQLEAEGMNQNLS